MSLFSTLLVKLRLHTMKRRCESGKQPTTGSHIQRKLNPVPVSLNEAHEWCEWMKLKFSQVSANRITLRMIPNGEVQSLTNPIQATATKSCELCEWSRSHVQVFLSKRVQSNSASAGAQSHKMRATEAEPKSHIKKERDYQEGRNQGRENNSTFREEMSLSKHLIKGGCWSLNSSLLDVSR